MRQQIMSEHSWPTNGTSLVVGIQPAGFVPVTKEILGEIVSRIVTALHPEKIILFGSYVYGRPSPDSDVDLLVIMESSSRPVDRYLAVSQLIRPRPFPLDIVVRTPGEIDQALKNGDSFSKEIISLGKVLYERSN